MNGGKTDLEDECFKYALAKKSPDDSIIYLVIVSILLLQRKKKGLCSM